MAERAKRPAARPPSPPVARRRRIVVRLMLALVIAVALLFVFVFPARTLLDQRQETQNARDVLRLLRAQNAQLEGEKQRLQDDAEVERIAREQYGLVRPGETPYVAVEGTTTTTTVPPPAPTSPTTSPPTAR